MPGTRRPARGKGADRSFDRAMPEGRDASGRIDGLCYGDAIAIEAPPELVWDFIADFEGWGAWNPLYRRTSGRAVEGARLAFTVMIEGMKPRPATATVSRVVPVELLEYGLSPLLGLVRVQRFVEIHELSPTRCRVVNGEIMGGPLGRAVGKRLGPKAATGLAEMNEALKDVAERKWRALRN